jgi:hypothetical protein
MRKKILGALGVFLLVQVLVYGLISFLIWNPNISTWTIDDRFFMVTLGMLAGFGVTATYVMFRDEIK